MDSDVLLKLFRERAALLEGHFELASTWHSPFYLQCARVLQDPDLTHRLCVELIHPFQGQRIDKVVGPAMGGIIIAYETARVLGVQAIYAERKEAVLELRRGFQIEKDENVLLVEDVVTTGGSILELFDLCQNLGAKVVGFASLMDRTGGEFHFPFPLKSLAQVDFPTYEKNQCPLCEKGVPVVKPGSQKIKQ
ncbi:MAG: orotate phosphoribosyltransferase [Chlamydiae bacterium]|nr:orotate phosphoribosyltransferase [Chlamydiota bacterium]MBI3277850.1 orotate phosphoribosyltransferase [Chlamydiota bacterium]